MTQELAKIQFQGSEIVTIRDKQGQEWVAVTSICQALGIDSPTQIGRLRSNPAFTGWDIPSRGLTDDKLRTYFCILVKELSSWLSGININKIPDSQTREKVLTFQKECQNVLDNYWRKGIAINPRMAMNEDDESIMIMEQMIALRKARIEDRKRMEAIEEVQEIQSITQYNQNIAIQENRQIAVQAMEHSKDVQRFAETGSYREGYYTVKCFGIAFKFRFKDLEERKRIGVACTNLCAKRGIPVDKVADPVYKFVNAYPETIIREIVMYKDDPSNTFLS